jgi:branched-chain amino acid transport system substrate-binding protein
MACRRVRTGLAVAGVALLIAAATGYGGSAAAPFRIGVLADCTGIGAATNDWSLAAAELPLLQHGGTLAGTGPSSGVRGATVAGRHVEIVTGCSESGVYGRLITETRQLVEIDHVDAVVGAFGWSDGVVFRELARRYPTVPFLLAGSFVREATAHVPAGNLYRFSADVEQAQAGLATYAYKTLGWRSAATVAEPLANGWGAAAAFAAEFCALGGSVRHIWAPAIAPSALRAVPRAVDGVVVIANYGYGNPVPFVRSYVAAHPRPARSLLLSLWLYPPIDQRIYAPLWQSVHGVVMRISGTPDPSSPSDVAYRKAFAAAFPSVPPSVAENLLVLPFYDAVTALLQSLAKTRGDVGPGRAKLRSALDAIRLSAPDGPVRLDRNRQAVVPATLVRIDRTRPGVLSFRRVRTIPAVDETLGGLLPANASPGPDTNDCHRAAPPPWAR